MDTGPLADLFHRAGCQGWLCALDIDGPAEVALDATVPVVAASVFKVTVALEFFRQVAGGRLEAAERVRLDPSDSAPGPTGFSTFTDEVEVSLRDLARMMLTISDNAATDVLLARVGQAAVNDTAATLGLVDTVVTASLRELLDGIGQELDYAGWQELQDAANAPDASPEFVAGLRRRLPTVAALVPESTTRTTARDMAVLLRLIWRDEAGPAQACAEVRQMMAAQVTRRVAAGFPPDVKVAAKSGSLIGIIRNEVAVVTYPDGSRYAVAVFTRADGMFQREGEINTAIRMAAVQAVGWLRS